MGAFNQLGGLASGLLGGMGQVRENIEARRRSNIADREAALRQLQEQRLQEQAQTAEAQMQLSAMEDGQEMDPKDPAVANIIQRLGAGALVKGPSGTMIMKKQSPADKKIEAEFAEWNALAPVRSAQGHLQLQDAQAKERLMGILSNQYGPDWQSKLMSGEIPINQRQMIGAQLYGKNDAFLTKEEELKFSPTVKAAEVSAAAMAPYREAGAQNMQDQRTMQLEGEWNKFLNSDLGKLSVFRDFKGNVDAAKAAWLQQHGATGMVPSKMKITQIQ